MFYSVYDILADSSKGQKIQIDKVLKTNGFTKNEIDLLKNNSNIPNDIQLRDKVLRFLGISELELKIMMGIIPKEFEQDYYSFLHEFASEIDSNNCKHSKSNKRLTPFFENEMGILYKDDCLNVLPYIESNTIDLIFADPPFNLKKDYGVDINDDMSISEYIDWSIRWIDECIRILKPGGSLYIYNIPKWCVYYANYLNKRLVFKNWIAIDMKNSFPIKNRYTPSHYGLLYYVKDGSEIYFDKQRLPIQTCRHCGGEIKDYGGYKNKMNVKGVNIADVWYDIYPVRTNKNRKYNELSLTLLDRIISFSSKENDVVLDPFGGSGTTFAVSQLLKRRWIGIEIGDCEVIKKRLLNNEMDKIRIEKIQAEKNVIFTPQAKKLRKKNGFWIPKGEEK